MLLPVVVEELGEQFLVPVPPVVEGGTVVVTDLHSRNGTHVVLPGKSPQKLRQGEPTTVIVGTVVDLGGGVTFTVSEG